MVYRFYMYSRYTEGLAVGIGTGNPGVFQGYPYPDPSLPVPTARGTGLTGTGHGF